MNCPSQALRRPLGLLLCRQACPTTLPRSRPARLLLLSSNDRAVSTTTTILSSDLSHDDKASSFRTNADNNHHDNNESNPGLASVIAQGVAALETTAAQIEAKTRRISLDQTPTLKSTPNQRQLEEGHRMLQVATECLEEVCEQQSHNYQYLTALKEPISLLDIAVNRDLKLAKIYWSLPYGLLLEEKVLARHGLYQRLMDELEPRVANQGQKVLSKHVSTRLRSYYPPRIKLVPATKDMVIEAVNEMMGGLDE